MKIKDQYRYDFPAYALSALFNGDYSGIEQDDIDNLESFLERESYIDHWDFPENSEPYFTPNPEFGLACDCVELIGIVWETDPEPETDEIDLSNAELYLDSRHGIYIPQFFFNQTMRDCIDWNCSDETKNWIINACSDPDNEDYWEAWDTALNCITVTDPTSNTQYQVHQDEDLWLIPMGGE